MRLLLLGLVLAGFTVSPPPTPLPQAVGGQERVPVLLLPGWLDDGEDLAPLRKRFIEAGWPEERVVALSFEDPVGSNRVHAREIARAIQLLLSDTGSDQVDVVAFSMGGLALRYYLAGEGLGSPVRRAVFLGTPHRGTFTAYFAWGEGGLEMEPGSTFLSDLNRDVALPSDVEALTIRTSADVTVFPHETSILPGARNLRVCCPSHRGLLRDEGAFALILQFLNES